MSNSQMFTYPHQFHKVLVIENILYHRLFSARQHAERAICRVLSRNYGSLITGNYGS